MQVTIELISNNMWMEYMRFLGPPAKAEINTGLTVIQEDLTSKQHRE